MKWGIGISIFTAKLDEHAPRMQAGFNAYAQTIRHHALLLAGFQKEIKELKQANTQQDAAVEELQQVNTEKGVRIDELEKRINELQEGNGIISFQSLSCDSV